MCSTEINIFSKCSRKSEESASILLEQFLSRQFSLYMFSSDQHMAERKNILILFKKKFTIQNTKMIEHTQN